MADDNGGATKGMYKGQVATEFFIYAGVFLILVIAALVVVSFTQDSEVSSLEYSVAKETGQQFADAIDLAVRGGKGFTYVVYAQPSVMGRPYTLHFRTAAEEGAVYFLWEGPRGNFSYAYSTAPHAQEFYPCGSTGPASGDFRSDSGIAKVSFVNDGTKIKIIPECPK